MVIFSLSVLFLYLLRGCAMANFSLLSRKQSHSLKVNHCIWAICFGVKVTKRGCVSTPNWVRVGFDEDYITHLFKIAENTLPRLAAKCGNAPNTQNSYCLAIVWTVSLFIGGQGGVWNIWKNYISDFFVKIGREIRSKGGREGGGKHCFSLIR